jgi:hypothetical protein
VLDLKLTLLMRLITQMHSEGEPLPNNGLALLEAWLHSLNIKGKGTGKPRTLWETYGRVNSICFPNILVNYICFNFTGKRPPNPPWKK